MQSEWIKNISNYERVESSTYVIQYIIDNLQIPDDQKFCVEFGYSSDNIDYNGNTHILVKKHGWKNLYLDGGHHNPDINLYQHYLTTENIVSIFDKYSVPKSLGYLSIDVDSTDIWLMDKLLDVYRPSLVTCEYNPALPHDVAIAFENDPNRIWNCDAIWGSSVKALTMVANKHDYLLIYIGEWSRIKAHDCFFAPKEKLPNIDQEYLNRLTYNTLNIHPLCKNYETNRCMIDYEEYIKTGDLDLAKTKCEDVVRKYLCVN